MTKRFYLISKFGNGEPLALAEASSKQGAMISYSKCFYSVRVANARDVAVAFQQKVLIISASEADALNPTTTGK